MEVKPGYRLAEVGALPADWVVHEIGELCDINAGRDLVKSDYSSHQDERHPFPIYSNALTGNGLYGYSSTFQFPPDKVTVTARGDIGHAAHRNTRFCAIGRLLVLSSKRVCDLRFLTEYINSFVEFAIESTGVPQLTAPQISKYVVGLPPTQAEQEAIAEALGDADALIESLEQLVAKKRRIKQGAMQELLTGKRRLPGFSGEWEVKRLGDVLTIAHGRNQRLVEDRNGRYPILASGGQIGTANQFLHDKPSVLIGRKGTIDQPQFMDTPFWTVDTLFYSLIREPNCAKFLFYRFFLIDWMRHNEASGVPSLNAGTIERIEVAIPQHREQEAVAALLSDLDGELTGLETKLTKARQIKQGMMQNLLTGRIRLI